VNKAIAYIRVYCYSNETRTSIANPPNTAQLQGTPYHCSKLYPGPCSSVGMRRGHTDTQMVVANIHFALAMPHAKCSDPVQEDVWRMYYYEVRVRDSNNILMQRMSCFAYIAYVAAARAYHAPVTVFRPYRHSAGFPIVFYAVSYALKQSALPRAIDFTFP